MSREIYFTLHKYLNKLDSSLKGNDDCHKLVTVLRIHKKFKHRKKTHSKHKT